MALDPATITRRMVFPAVATSRCQQELTVAATASTLGTLTQQGHQHTEKSSHGSGCKLHQYHHIRVQTPNPAVVVPPPVSLTSATTA
uniref:Uncharacterized protein n=1 Tax=Oryza punctata TaxID=4537 RepID=A0A0E0JXH8_ORYPU